MSEDEFWFATPRYFSARQKAHTENFTDGWEQTRFIAYVMAKTVDSKKRIRKPADLLPFPWDAPTKKFKKITAEEREALEKFDKEADLIMQKYHPEQWAKILKAREEAQNGK
jgi:hypothetical protein